MKTEKNFIIFPFPDSRLSPNKRIDRRQLIPIHNAAKDEAYLIIKESGLKIPEQPLKLTLVFLPPDKHKRDLDNLYSSFKAYQDGIFFALGLDDSYIVHVELKRGSPVPNGCVAVRLEIEK